VYSLLPPQYKAVADKGLLRSSANSLIALPTSAGKTLLGELCLLAALGKGPGLVCYLAPYVALGRQVADSFRRHLPSAFQIHALVGGHRAGATLDPDSRAEVIVATPERLDSLLRVAPEVARKLKCLVCDEAHMIQSGTRGVRLEGLIARLRLLQSRRGPLRLVLTSAVLPEYEKLTSWIDIPPAAVITDSWRPTARRLALWRQDGVLAWYVGADPIRRAGVSNDTVIGVADVPWPKVRFYPAEHFGAIRKQEPDVFENVAYLVDLLCKRYGGAPILCYCTSRHSTRRMAAAIALRFPILEPLPDRLSASVSLIDTRHKALRPLAVLLRRGIAYHNASLPHQVRIHIEEAVKQREIIVVTATTTLAEGVDLPFRFTVLSDWLTWEGAQQRPMQSLLFRNIAGRCGRAGVMTEGDTIVFDNPLGAARLTNPFTRHSIQIDLFINQPVEGLHSTLSQVHSGSDEYEACIGELSSQFLAAIQENPDDGDLITSLGSHLYSTQYSAVAPRIYNHLSATRTSLLDDSHGALATAASPLRLTAFGRAALRTSFSPESCRRIAQLLSEEGAPADTAGLANHLLLRLGSLPEQPHDKLRKVLSGKRNSQFQVKQEDLHDLLKQWLAGEPLEGMFLSLPVLKRSTKKPKITDWAAGLSEPTVWDDDFDIFCDVVTLVFEGFLPRLMSACQGLSSIVGGWSPAVDWDTHSQFIEYGVDSLWAVAVLRSDISAERRPAAILGRKVPASSLSPSDPLGLTAIRSDPDRRQEFTSLVGQCIADAGGADTPVGEELRELTELLFRAARIPIGSS
jgi:helicase